MIAHAHTDTCRCYNCSPGHVLAATGGWEWADDGRPLRTIEDQMDAEEQPPRHWAWYVCDVAVMAIALASLWAAMGGEGW